MRRYNPAFHHWSDATFPQVLFIVPDDLRLRLVETVVKRQETPGLFDVTTATDVTRRLIA